jgi:hypothetical protein
MSGCTQEEPGETRTAAASAHPIVLDAAFRDLLASALIARHRAQTRNQPELMFMWSIWDADEWARTEADTLLAHIRTVLAHRVRAGVAELPAVECRRGAVTRR